MSQPQPNTPPRPPGPWPFPTQPLDYPSLPPGPRKPPAPPLRHRHADVPDALF